MPCPKGAGAFSGACVFRSVSWRKVGLSDASLYGGHGLVSCCQKMVWDNADPVLARVKLLPDAVVVEYMSAG